MSNHYGSNHWASNHWQSNHFAGSHVVVPPATTGSSGKSLEYLVDKRQYDAAYRRVENNARMAIILAAVEADEP